MSAATASERGARLRVFGWADDGLRVGVFVDGRVRAEVRIHPDVFKLTRTGLVEAVVAELNGGLMLAQQDGRVALGRSRRKKKAA